MGEKSVENKLGELSLEQSPLTRLYKGPTSDLDDAAAIIASSPQEDVKLAFENNPAKTLELFVNNDIDSKTLIKNINTETSLKYLPLLTQIIKKKSTAEEFCLTLFDSLINNFEYNLNDLEPMISLLIPRIADYPIVTMTLVKLYALYKHQVIPVFSDNLEMLSLDDHRFIACCKFITLMFQLDAHEAATMFDMDSVRLMLYKASGDGVLNSKEAISNGLLLLSTACVDEPTRKTILNTYIDLLIKGTQQQDTNIRSLAALVIVKTWNFQSLQDKSIKLEDLLDTFLENLNEHSIEGLAYLSMKKSIKGTLRKDGEFLIELMQKLENPGDQLYGVVVILANLSALEEDGEVNELKKHAQKGIEEGIEESKEEIQEFIDDLIELKTVSKICSLSKMSKQCMDQVIRVFYNFTKRRNHHKELVKQGALVRILEFIGRETEYTEYKVMAYKSLSSLLTTCDPHLVFGPQISSKTAVNYLFQFLQLEQVTMKDQFQTLLSLTNLSVLDNGPLSTEQWDTLDDLLTQSDHTLIKRATLELISNLMQHKTNLPALFNWELPKNKKRYDLIVKMTRLPDVKSQCSAISSLSFAITFEFIGEMLLKDATLRECLVKIMEEQTQETPLIERCAIVLYYLLFYADGTENMKLFQGNQTLTTALDTAIIVQCQHRGILEMLTEVKSLLKG